MLLGQGVWTFSRDPVTREPLELRHCETGAAGIQTVVTWQQLELAAPLRADSTRVSARNPLKVSQLRQSVTRSSLGLAAPVWTVSSRAVSLDSGLPHGPDSPWGMPWEQWGTLGGPQGRIILATDLSAVGP